MAKSNFIVRGGADFSGIKKEMQKTQASVAAFQNSISKSLSGLGKIAAAALSAGAILNFGKSSVEAASKSASAWMGLQSVVKGMGGSFLAAQGYLEKYISDGLVPAADAAAAYKSLTAAKYDTKQIEELMEAFKNSAVYSRQSGLTIGEAVRTATEGLKNLNSVNVDNAGVTKNLSVMQKEYAASIGKTVGKLTEAEIRQAHYTGIMRETRVQMGDAASYTQTYAGSVARLSAAFTALKEAVGSVIQYFAAYVIPVLINVINAFTKFVNIIRNALGIESVQAAASIQGSFASITDGASDAAGGMEKMSEAAKQAQKSVSGIDELNVISSGESGGGEGGSAGDAGGGADIPDIFESMEIPDTAQKLADNLLKSFGPLTDSLERLKKAFEPFSQEVGKGLKDFYEHILKPLASWTVGQALPVFFDGLTKILTSVDWENIRNSFITLYDAIAKFAGHIGGGLLWMYENVLVPLAVWGQNSLLPAVLEGIATVFGLLSETIAALKPLGLWLWESFLQPLGKWTGGVIVTVLERTTAGLKSFSDWISGNQKLAEGIAVAIGSFFAAWKIVGFAQTIGGIITTLGGFITSGGLAAAVTGAFSAAMAFLTSPITLAIAAITGITAVIVLLVKNWDTVKETAQKVWDKVCEIWGKAAAWFNDKVIQPLSNILKPMAEAVSGIFKSLWDKISEVWGKASQWFDKTVVLPIVNIFLPIVEKVFEIFAKLWEIITVLFSAAAGWFNVTVVQPVITAFTSLIAKTKEIFNNIWNGITEIFKSAAGWFSERFTEAWNAVKKVFEPVGEFFKGVWDTITRIFTQIGSAIGNAVGDAFKYVVNSIINFAENSINGFIRSINRVISLINNIPGVRISPLTELSVPRLAKGGIVDGATLAIIGEAGKEAVMPLENNAGWISELASQINAQGGGGMLEEKLDALIAAVKAGQIINLDGRKVNAGAERAKREQGVNIFPGGVLFDV